MNRALVGAVLVAFACFASSAHAGEPAPASPAPAEPSTPSTSGAAATAPAPAQSATTEPPPATASKRTAWPWIIIGTGIALVVTATVIEVKAVSEDDARQKDEIKFSALPQTDPARAPLVASAQSHDDSAKSDRTMALVLGTVGFLAIAGSVVLWFVEGSSSSPDPAPAKAAKAAAPRPSPLFAPLVGPGYAGATFGASF